MKIHFIKCHGSGNDFALIDEFIHPIFTEEQRAIVAQSISDRSGPVGSDGVLFYLSSDENDVQMRMFNPDGSEPQTCANGLRCVARYAEQQLSLSEVTIEIMKGYASAHKVEDAVPGVFTTSVTIGPISLNPSDLPLVINKNKCINERIESLSSTMGFTALSAPNPHLVSVVDNIDENDLVSVGNIAEQSPPELPERANVSFIMKVDVDTMFVSTFERGAGITGSCGSAMASSSVAACLMDLFNFGEKIRVVNRNGIVFCTPYKKENGDIYVEMIGNATFVYEADVDIDFVNGKLSNVVSGIVNLDEIEAYSHLHEEAKKYVLENGVILAKEGLG